MPKYMLTIPLIVFTALFTGCALNNNDYEPLTQLEIREIQSREFECQDTKTVLKAMMNALQDEGFIIKNVVLDVGLLSAEKQIDIESSWHKFIGTNLGENQLRWKKYQVFEVSANITSFGQKVRVRVNLQTKTLDNVGNLMHVETNQNPFYYQNFFEKVDKGLFIQYQDI